MLGKNATEPPLMRLPMRCFLDFRPGGSLCHIICTMYRFKVDQCLESFEFDLTEHHHLYMEMSKKILENLINQKCFPWPTIYFQPEFDDVLRDQLTDILKERQCEITEDENLATHIIYPEIECSTDDYARPLFKQGNNIMIHWYYLPESYDSFVTDTFNFSVSEKFLASYISLVKSRHFSLCRKNILTSTNITLHMTHLYDRKNDMFA